MDLKAGVMDLKVNLYKGIRWCVCKVSVPVRGNGFESQCGVFRLKEVERQFPSP